MGVTSSRIVHVPVPNSPRPSHVLIAPAGLGTLSKRRGGAREQGEEGEEEKKGMIMTRRRRRKKRKWHEVGRRHVEGGGIRGELKG